jgi:hypothetical protein
MVSTLEAGLQLTFDGFEILDVTSGLTIDDQYIEFMTRKSKRTSFEEGDFASLLVRGGEGLFEARVPFPELIASALLGLDALLANGFAAPKDITLKCCA